MCSSDLGTMLRTLVMHGMPHFENSSAMRGAPILSARAVRDFGAKDHLSWEHVALIRQQWTRTLVIKGLMHADDARTARDMGVDGVILSNHGGRQLDGTVSPLRVLPEVAWKSGLGDATVLLARPGRTWKDAPPGFPPGWEGRLDWVQVPGADRKSTRLNSSHT